MKQDVLILNNSNKDVNTDLEETMLGYYDHPLSDEEAQKLGRQVATHEDIYHPPNTMHITLNFQK